MNKLCRSYNTLGINKTLFITRQRGIPHAPKRTCRNNPTRLNGSTTLLEKYLELRRVRFVSVVPVKAESNQNIVDVKVSLTGHVQRNSQTRNRKNKYKLDWELFTTDGICQQRAAAVVISSLNRAIKPCSMSIIDVDIGDVRPPVRCERRIGWCDSAEDYSRLQKSIDCKGRGTMTIEGPPHPRRGITGKTLKTSSTYVHDEKAMGVSACFAAFHAITRRGLALQRPSNIQ